MVKINGLDNFEKLLRSERDKKKDILIDTIEFGVYRVRNDEMFINRTEDSVEVEGKNGGVYLTEANTLEKNGDKYSIIFKNDLMAIIKFI